MVNPGGEEIRTYKKKPYYKCDLGPRGQGVLRQTLLSFPRTPTTPARTGEEHNRAGVSNFSNFSSNTVGQHGMKEVRAASEQNLEG